MFPSSRKHPSSLPGPESLLSVAPRRGLFCAVAWPLLTSHNGVSQRGTVGAAVARQAGDRLAAAREPSRDPQLLHLGDAHRQRVRHSLQGEAVGHPQSSHPPQLTQWAALTPAGAQTRRTDSSASSLGPGHYACPSAAPPACNSSAAGSPGIPPRGSCLWEGRSCWELVGAMGCGGGWGRDRLLTSAPVDGEGLCRARAPLQAVLEAVSGVVSVSASHTPHEAAESCCL